MKKVIKAHEHIIQHQIETNQLNNKNIGELIKKINASYFNAEETIKTIPGAIETTSQANNLMYRDADAITDLKQGFHKGILDVPALIRLANGNVVLNDLVSDETEVLGLDVDGNGITIEFFRPIKDKSTSIYKVAGFREQIGPVSFRQFIGPPLVMINQTMNCSKFLNQEYTD